MPRPGTVSLGTLGRSKNFFSLCHEFGLSGAYRALRLLLERQVRWRIASLFSPRSSMVTVHGDMQMLVQAGDTGISRELRLFGSHEPILTHLLTRNLKVGDSVLDIGANIGYYTLLLRKLVGATGEVIAVEPSSTNFDTLESNLRLNNLLDVKLLKAAIGSRPGKATLYRSQKSNWSTVVPRNDEIYSSSEEVDLQTVDFIVEHFGIRKLNALRMDIEGFEFYAIDGMLDVLKEHRPILFIEVHPDVFSDKDIVIAFWRKLFKLGYQVRYIIPRPLDSIIPFNIAKIAKYGWRYGTIDLADRFSLRNVGKLGSVLKEQYIIVLQ